MAAVVLAVPVLTLPALLAVPVLASGEQSSTRQSPPEAVQTARVLPVGDSITHGTDGDRTWRWFAWREWQRVGAGVDLVGPRRQPYTPPGESTSHYAAPRFDADHAALWGDRVAVEPRQDARALVEEHDPDVVVLQLGTNDFARTDATGAQVLGAVERWVLAAREVRPGTSLVLVEILSPRSGEVARHNAGLHALAARLDAPHARVVVARASTGFVPSTFADPDGDTYDRYHPNVRGDALIAASVVDAVARVGVGRPHRRPLEFLPEGPVRRPVLKARGGDGSLRLTWTRPRGMTGVEVWLRAPGTRWRLQQRRADGSSSVVEGLTACVPYRVKVVPVRELTRAAPSRHSRTRTVRVGGDVRGVSGVSATVSRSQVSVRFGADPQACRYRVRVRAGGAVRTVVTDESRVRVLRPRGGGRVTARVQAIGVRGVSPWSSPIHAR